MIGAAGTWSMQALPRSLHEPHLPFLGKFDVFENFRKIFFNLRILVVLGCFSEDLQNLLKASQ